MDEARARLVVTAMGDSDIGAVTGVFVGPITPSKRRSVNFCAKVRSGSMLLKNSLVGSGALNVARLSPIVFVFPRSAAQELA